MTLKAYKTAMCASAFLAAMALPGGAFAAGAAGDLYGFETNTTGAISANTALGEAGLTGLAGNGTIVAGNPAAASRPLPSESTENVLEIAGTVTYTNDVSSGVPSQGASQVDFLFKVEPTDELERIEDSTVQVALAVGVTNAVGKADIKLWCKESAGGNADWVSVLQSVTVGEWIRATLVLDYINSKCKVSFNGDFAAEKFLAGGTAEQNFLKSITMVGSTQIDEFVIKHESLADYNPYKDSSGNDLTVTAADDTAVTLKYLNDHDIKTNEVNTVKNETSGMTVAQKFVAGLKPTSATKFEFKTITPFSNDPADIDKMKVTFPGDGSTYTVTVSSDRAGTTTTYTAPSTSPTEAKTDANETINEATVELPSGGVGYIHLKATK